MLLPLTLALSCQAEEPRAPVAEETPVNIASILANPVDIEDARKPLLLTEAAAAWAVVVGRLVEVGPPPAGFSGLVMATQALTYEIQTVIHGDLPADRLTVHQILVERSPLVQRETPALLPRYTEIGQRYVVLLAEPDEGDQHRTASDTVGLTTATDELVAELSRAPRK